MMQAMAQSVMMIRNGTCYRYGVLRVVVVLVVVGVFLLGSIVNPQRSSQAQASCPSCDCDCASQSDLSLPFELNNGSYADCGKIDPDMDQELQKNVVSLLSEELALQRAVAKETLGHTRALTMEAKRVASHYRREAEKCNMGMETCEGARERAERELVEERRLTTLWENRARERGWTD